MKSRFRIFPILLAASLACLILQLRGHAQQPANLVTVDASARQSAPETGYLHLGGTSSNGHSLQVNSRYLLLDGKPWLPVMGELHYTRVPESQWEDEILKMKAAGVNIVSTYVFWIHHEEIEGHFDWTGRRDLRHFVELCAKHHMYVWLRPGPWAHGEVRNGGFPDWVAKLPNTRTNDPVYLEHVASLFNQIGQQVRGLMFQDGGPIIGTQLENEYGLHGPGRGAEHILKLKQIAIAAGINPPLFSVTGWPSLDFPPHEVIPVSGGYPDGFWYGSQEKLPPSMNYLFNFNRELGDMGATVPSEDPTGKVNLGHDPYFGAEEAGGMASAYHRRPVVGADDVAALALTGIGSGINLYGYYMFHGGTNPKGKLTTLQESAATGYPNDLPELTYDFGAPIGEFGQEREAYRKTRLLHLFVNAYGPELAPMAAFAPSHYTRDAGDTRTPRVAVRSDGTSGFIFVNNYVRQLAMPARPGFQLKIKLQSGEVDVPTKPIDVPANTYFVWPFELALGTAKLNYSTSQLLTHLATPHGDVVVFFAVPGIAPQFDFDSRHIRTISAPAATVTHIHKHTTVTNLSPALNSTIELTDDHGSRTTILLLTKDQAEQTTLLRAGPADHLLLTASSVLFDGSQLRLRTTASPSQRILLLPDLPLQGGTEGPDGIWMSHNFTQPAKDFSLAARQTQQTHAVKSSQDMTMGPYSDWRKASVPLVPPDSAFDRAATWHLAWKPTDVTGLSNLLLRVDYTGDIARLTIAGDVVDDNFFNGLPWEVGFNPFDSNVAAKGLDLSILPLPARPPIYLDSIAHSKLDSGRTTPTVTQVQLIPEYETVVGITLQAEK